MTQTTPIDAAPGEIFIRSADMPRAWFTESYTVTATGTKPVFWPSGTPLTGGNAATMTGTDASINTNLTSRALVYTPAKLIPGVPTKISIVDSKYNYASNSLIPGAFAGIKINVSRLPLTHPGMSSLSGTARTYTLAAWKLALDRMGIAWFEEGSRVDAQPN